MSELKPCPFCGGEPRLYDRIDENLWDHSQVKWITVSCNNVGCDASGFDLPEAAEPNSIDLWNRRADRPAPSSVSREEIAKLVAKHRVEYVGNDEGVYPVDYELADAILPHITGGAVTVKPVELEWIDHPPVDGPVIAMAETPLGTYFICDDNDDFTGLYCELITHQQATWYGTVKAKTYVIADREHVDDPSPIKTMAEADFQSRLSTLTPASEPDTGWRSMDSAPSGPTDINFHDVAWGDPDDLSTGPAMRHKDKYFAPAVFYRGGPKDQRQYEFREIEIKPFAWKPSGAAPDTQPEPDVQGSRLRELIKLALDQEQGCGGTLSPREVIHNMQVVLRRALSGDE